MDFLDRRQPQNAQLRQKIDQLQAMGQQLQATMDQVQVQTVRWAREQKLTDLPHAALAHDLSATFRQQRAALMRIHEEIKGADTRELAQLPTQLLTDEELNALMK